MPHRSIVMALLLIVLAMICIPMGFMFLWGGWMAKGGEGTLLVFLLGIGLALVALCVVTVRLLRPRK